MLGCASPGQGPARRPSRQSEAPAVGGLVLARLKDDGGWTLLLDKKAMAKCSRKPARPEEAYAFLAGKGELESAMLDILTQEED